MDAGISRLDEMKALIDKVWIQRHGCARLEVSSDLCLLLISNEPSGFKGEVGGCTGVRAPKHHFCRSVTRILDFCLDNRSR